MKYIAILTSFFIVVLGACKKQTNNNPVPETYIDVYVNITAPGYTALTAVGGHVYLTGGNNGIILFRKSYDEFKAYDRTCTYDATNKCSYLKVETSGLTAIDTCCKSQFTLSDGSVVSPPASINLRQYQTAFDGSNTVHIFN